MACLSETAERISGEFEEYLASDGKAAKTVESYIGDIKATQHALKPRQSFLRHKFFHLRVVKLLKLVFPQQSSPYQKFSL